MANKPVAALVKCPFFEEENGNTLKCEGYYKNSCMLTRFSNAEAKHAHLKQNCYKETGGSCFMARSLFQKYEALELAEEAARAAKRAAARGGKPA